ncbi:MAG TPA: hypothetical protein VLQ89_02160 [Candidatus Binatia bacterium]|nr:hypothetical protein [Candidatus Binatia bacterium]
MKKKFFLCLLLLSFVLSAHPPKSIELSYDGEKATLAVKVWHKVGDPESHIIEKISVFLGDEQIAEKAYTRQQTESFQADVFDFSAKPLKPGDIIKVRATCNKFGRKTVQLEWPK